MKQKFFSVGTCFLMVTLFILFFNSFGNPKVEAAELENINGLSLTEQDIQHLLSLGFSEDEIINMDQEEYELNKDLNGEVVASTTQFLKIVEVPQELSNQLDDTSTSLEPVFIELDEKTFNEELNKLSLTASESTSTSYKKMTTSITKLATNKYRLKNSVTWSRIPSTRYTDVSGVGINQAYWGPSPGTQYGKQNWRKWSPCDGYKNGNATYTSSSTKWKKGAGGYALNMNLPNNDFGGGCSAERVDQLSSYMYYTVTPLTSTNRLDGYGQYAHQESTISVLPSISLSGISFSVSPASKFSVHPNTHVLVYK